MKKLLAITLSLLMVLGMLAGCGAQETAPAPAATQAPAAEAPAAEAPQASYMDELIAAAQAEGTLVVYGSCEEEYLAAAAENIIAINTPHPTDHGVISLCSPEGDRRGSYSSPSLSSRKALSGNLAIQ